MAIKIHSVDQGSDLWHKLRDGKYTGSNAHKLLKFGAVDYSLTERSNFKGNFYTKRGHTLEEQAVELYKTITKSDVKRPGFVTNTIYPTAGYSPDALSGNDVVVEVKCFNKEKHKKMFSGEIPLTVLAQVHFGLLICGRKLAHLVIYNPDFAKEVPARPELAFKIIPIKRDPLIIANFKRILAA